jgi:hypothetical protein
MFKCIFLIREIPTTKKENNQHIYHCKISGQEYNIHF